MSASYLLRRRKSLTRRNVPFFFGMRKEGKNHFEDKIFCNTLLDTNSVMMLLKCWRWMLGIVYGFEWMGGVFGSMTCSFT